MEFRGRNLYAEAPDTGDGYRKAYADGLDAYINKLNAEGAKKRKEHMPPACYGKRLEDYRMEYLHMLGIADADVGAPEAYTCTEVGSDDMCRIYRYVFHMQEGIPFYGILFVPHGLEKPAPLLIAQHGNSGTPELCSDMIGENNYKHMVRRAVERGAVVFAPQLLLWRFVDNGSPNHRLHPIPYHRSGIDVALKRFGMSMTGLELTFIRRAISFFSDLDFVCGDKIGMVGHSYGGYFTLYTMAADTRIKAGYASSFFNNRDCVAFDDWTYPNSGNLFQDAEVAALCAPRKLFLSIGKTDPFFDYRSALTEFDRAREYYGAWGKEANFVFFLWDGPHSINPTDEGFDFLFAALEEENV